MSYKNYYQKDDFDMREETDYTVNNDINHLIPANMYESEYTIGSVKKQIKKFQPYDNDESPVQCTQKVGMRRKNKKGTVKSIFALLFSTISVCILFFISKLYNELKPFFDSADILKDETTDFAAKVLGPQSYVYIGLGGLFLFISLLLSISSIKTFTRRRSYEINVSVITLLLGTVSLLASLFAIALIILLFLGTPILMA